MAFENDAGEVDVLKVDARASTEVLYALIVVSVNSCDLVIRGDTRYVYMRRSDGINELVVDLVALNRDLDVDVPPAQIEVGDVPKASKPLQSGAKAWDPSEVSGV